MGVAAEGSGVRRIRILSECSLGGLVPDRLHSLNLFDSLDAEQSRAKLLEAMDQLNQKYGMSTLAPATMLSAYKAAPTRIAFHSIPELF